MKHSEKSRIHLRQLMDDVCQTVRNSFPFLLLTKKYTVSLTRMCAIQIIDQMNSLEFSFISIVPCPACEGFPVKDSASSCKVTY